MSQNIPFQVNAVLLKFIFIKESDFFTLFSASIHHIRVISEGSCDTK